MNLEPLRPLKIEKNISPIFHYFLLFWFILSFLAILTALFLFLWYITPYFPEIVSYIKAGIHYLQENNDTIIGALNG